MGVNACTAACLGWVVLAVSGEAAICNAVCCDLVVVVVLKYEDCAGAGACFCLLLVESGYAAADFWVFGLVQVVSAAAAGAAC